jgi:hypothetical protein
MLAAASTKDDGYSNALGHRDNASPLCQVRVGTTVFL